jgi:two-component system chemotaxis response regulator CheY
MKKILVVDDSETVRLEVGRALKAAGYGVVEAADGVEGLERTSAEALDLVLLDVNMPRMGGLEMLEELRKTEGSRKVPVLILTTEVQDSMIERAKRAGASGWIYKPPQMDLLVKTVNKLVG